MITINELQQQILDLQDAVADLEGPLLKAAKTSELQLKKMELEVRLLELKEASDPTELQLKKMELEVRLLELKEASDPIELRKKEADASLAETKAASEKAAAESAKQIPWDALKIAAGCAIVGLLGSLVRI